MKILLLTSAENGKSQQYIIKEAEKRGHTVETYCPTELVPYISSTKSGHDMVFTKDKETNSLKRLYSSHFDVVCARFSGSSSFTFGCAILEHFSANLGIPVSSDPLGLERASHKFTSHQALSIAKVRTIPTLFINKPIGFKDITNILGTPLVCKSPHGSKGSCVFILTDPLSVSTTLSAFSRFNKNLLLQKFIDTGTPASDFRILVCDGVVVASFQRWALDDSFLSNYSISKTGTKANLTEEEKTMAIEAAYSIGLPGICGVDLVRDARDNNKPYIIEVNGNPSLEGITAISGVNVASFIVDYLERIARKKTTSKNSTGVNNELQKLVHNNHIQSVMDKTMKLYSSGEKIALK